MGRPSSPTVFPRLEVIRLLLRVNGACARRATLQQFVGIRGLTVDVAEELQRETLRILQHAKPPKSNFTNKERTNTPKNQPIRNSQIPVHEQTGVIQSEALPPRLYGLQKIHKPDGPLRPIIYIGNTTSHVKDSAHFIDKTKTHTLKQTDLLVSFDVVLLFTMAPIKNVIEQLRESFSYFQWNKDFYGQLDGVAMGSSLAPVIANFYMEFLESRTLDIAAQKPRCWRRYVDDTFIMWPHEVDMLRSATSEPSAAGQRLRKSAYKEGNTTKQLETDRQRTPTVQRLVADSVPTLYQERYGPNRQDTRAQYKNDIQTHAAITPPATFGEGP
ncbi:hypothetical protein Trydic_g10622 [Trypoxylus dichotomus]